MRVSFIADGLAALGAQMTDISGGLVARAIPGESPSAPIVLRDLSPLPRTGFKGADTPAWLTTQGVTFDPPHNAAYGQTDGSLLARLSPGEFLLLSPLSGQGSLIPAVNEIDRCTFPRRAGTSVPLAAASMAAANDHRSEPMAVGLIHSLNDVWSWQAEAGLCFPVPRQDSHAWFHLSGPQTAAMFAKICGIDLRPHRFANLSIAQTSVARLNGIIIRDDRGGVLSYHLLADSASAAYLWDCLQDAMEEFGGSVAGIASMA